KNGDALLGNRSQRADSSCHRRWSPSIKKDQRTDNQGNCGHQKSDCKRSLGPPESSNWTNANGRGGAPSSRAEFLRDLRVAQAILVEVKQVQAQPLLDFAFAEVVQDRVPMPEVAKVP